MPKTAQPRRHPWRRFVLVAIVVVLAGGGYVWWRAGFTVDVSRFFAVDVGVLTVQCGTNQNTLTWTYDSRANSNGVQRGNDGPKNLPDCADYWCWLPNNSYPHQVPAAGSPAAYADTQLQPGECHEYRIKYRPDLPSNSVFCPVNCDVAGTTPPPSQPAVDARCDGSNGPCDVPVGSSVTISWTSTGVTDCTETVQGLGGNVTSGTGAGISGSNTITMTSADVGTVTYTYGCTGPGGSASDSVAVNVITAEEPLACSANAQTVESGRGVTFTAQNGSDLSWTAQGGSPDAGQGPTFQTSFTHAGLPEAKTFDVEVFDSATEQQATCSVTVACAAPTCATPPEGCSYANANVCECGMLVCPSGSPTPTPETLVCAPTSQVVAVGAVAVFDASGGSGIYGWSSPGGTAQSSTTASRYRASYAQTGGYTVSVNDGQAVAVAQCTVSVVARAVSPTPIPMTGLEVLKSARNLTRGGVESQTISASPGDRIEFHVRISQSGNQGSEGVRIRDVLDSRMFYVTGSTRRDGTELSDGITSPNGMLIGSVEPGAGVDVYYHVTLAGAGTNGTGAFSTGITRITNAATVTVDGIAGGTGSYAYVDVMVSGTVPSASVIPNVAEVPTGPGQATMLALIVSAIVTLLYVGYTSTGMFRRREAATIAHANRRDPTFHR